MKRLSYMQPPTHMGTTRTTREVIAGITTFLTMAYVLFVHPAVLSTDFTGKPTGLDFGAVLLATCVVSGTATIVMGLWAKYPIALAPGMGENFFFVSVITALAAAGVAEPWRAALGIVFVSGVIFLILSVVGVREALLDSVSPSMRNAIAAGIGFFVAFIGLRNGGLIVAHPGTLVTLNPHLVSADVAVFTVGLLTAAVLHVRNVRGAILIGIAVAAVVAAALGKIHYNGVVGLPHIATPAALRFDIATALSSAVAAVRGGVSVHERVRHARLRHRGGAAGRVDAGREAAEGRARARRRRGRDGAWRGSRNEHDRHLHRERRGRVRRWTHGPHGRRCGIVVFRRAALQPARSA